MGRQKPKHLTKVKRKTQEWKEGRIEEARSSVENFQHIYVLAFENQRNVHVKAAREHLRPSRLFYGKNKLLQKALGASPETEVATNVYKISKTLSGEKALLFSDRPPHEIQSFFVNFRPEQFARAGEVASFSVVLSDGSDALSQFPHSLEPQLRSLGLPTILKDGKIHLLGAHSVCKEGEPLSAGAAQLLKLLDVKMSQFSVRVESHWSDGMFELL